MSERINGSKLYWLTPVLLLIFPTLVMILWWRWTPPEPARLEAVSMKPRSSSALLPVAVSSQTTEPRVGELSASSPESPLSPLTAVPAPPRVTPALTVVPSTPTRRAARAELTDDVIASFDPETMAMLNGHKYWSYEKQALVDGLYDQWLNEKHEGADTENARRQIAWALEGRFMENY